MRDNVEFMDNFFFFWIILDFKSKLYLWYMVVVCIPILTSSVKSLQLKNSIWILLPFFWISFSQILFYYIIIKLKLNNDLENLLVEVVIGSVMKLMIASYNNKCKMLSFQIIDLILSAAFDVSIIFKVILTIAFSKGGTCIHWNMYVHRKPTYCVLCKF